MSDREEPAGRGKRQSAEIRGDIQKGLTDDKVPGFDPAAAPMETDAEAAGNAEPLPGYEGLDVHPVAGSHDANASSHGNAMRPFDTAKPASSARMLKIILAVVVVLILAVFLILRA